jgi:protocatechuate 3,4-dioxygenase beta subunit
MNIKPVANSGVRIENSSVLDSNPFVERVIAAMDPHGPGADPVLQGKIAILVKHLHAAVDELQLKEHELYAAIDFFTRACKNDDTMFLADMTAISMRVNDITFAVPNGTAPNVIGPLYRENAPFIDNPGSLVEDNETGEHVLISGEVVSAETGRALPGAILDLWQTDALGKYENEDPSQPDYNFRRRIRTNASGRYQVHTVIPGAYEVGNRDTPAADFLVRLGRGRFRPPHIHLMVECAGYEELTTMIYFEGQEKNAQDCIFSCRPQNIARLDNTYDATLPNGKPLQSLTFNIALGAKIKK